MSLASVSICNNFPSLPGLYAFLAQLDLLDEERLRPGWDTYFMVSPSPGPGSGPSWSPTLGFIVHRIVRVRLTLMRWPQTLASLASHRSNCMKRRVGALLVRSKRILSTGYNGTPRGTLNCNKGGCGRCNGSARGGEARE
jgi:dCMP deaminase